ncbi:MAG TPA: FAD-dependent thymidylate synthase [Clostridiaceae bacterium]
MKVKLIQYTKDPEMLVAAAAKLCYSPVGVEDILEDLDSKNIDKFLSNLLSVGHESPIEHVSFTFAIEGVSRSLSHQLVRHRIASYSQQSQRYVALQQFEYIIPPEIEESEDSKKIFIEAMKKCQEAYCELYIALNNKYLSQSMTKFSSEKKAAEDARYVFPNACETKIMVTMNARSLNNFFNVRCCNRAQWEIRNLAKEMLKLVKEVAPTLFKTSGPSCVKGACREGKMSCGKGIEVRENFLGGK